MSRLPLVLRSPHRPARARALVAASTDHILKPFGRKPVKRLILGPLIMIVRRADSPRAQPRWLMLWTAEDGGGSRLRGGMSANPVFRAGMVVWVAMLSLGLVGAAAEGWASGAFGPVNVVVGGVGLLMLGGLWLALRAPVPGADEDREMLVAFALRTLSARPAARD